MTMMYEVFMKPCVFMEKKRVSDGLGGYTTEWTEGASLEAAIQKNETIQAKIAEKQGVTELYTITTNRNVPLDFHDVIKRVSDGMIFRVTSNIKDNKSPTFSAINIGQVTAEAWVLE